MRVMDAGHEYALDCLDGKMQVVLTFVKRVGKKYPGNKNARPGTTLQEVLRACCDRLRYVDGQTPAPESQRSLFFLRQAILELENRAARLHGRKPILTADKAEWGDKCARCGHVGCPGSCHNKRRR